MSPPPATSPKVFLPLSVGSIPIYWGCPTITELFNPQCFVNCHDFENWEAVVDHVMEIENNPELYRNTEKHPPCCLTLGSTK